MTMAAIAVSVAPTGQWTRRIGVVMPMTAAMAAWRSWAVTPSWKSTSSLSLETTSSVLVERLASGIPASVTREPLSAFATT
uniref:Phospholipase A2, group IIE n=1 Tax=Mus musculus TaxID=10090 RepID=A2APQ4_MOUSE